MQRYSQNEPIQIKWFLILKNHCPLFNLTNFCSTWICHEITKCNRKQPASAAAFYFEYVYSNSDGYIIIHFENVSQWNTWLHIFWKGPKWYCRWAKYSSYKRWIIDKLGAGGLSSSQNCKTLPLPYITFIKKGGASSWNS